jgi:hypothetical protein
MHGNTSTHREIIYTEEIPELIPRNPINKCLCYLSATVTNDWQNTEKKTCIQSEELVLKICQNLSRNRAEEEWRPAEGPWIFLYVYYSSALHRNLIYVFPEKELCGLDPNFHIPLSVSDLYIPSPRIGPQQNRQTDCENI